jgi:hypothetical protein
METNRRMIAEAHPEDNCSFHSSVLNIRTWDAAQLWKPLDPDHEYV